MNNIGHLLFSPNGRIGQQDYWIGVLIIIAANIVAGMIPLLGFIISIGLIWVGIAVYGKRLHDAGKSAWLHVVPWGLSILFGIIGLAFAGGAVLTAIMADGDVDPIAMISAGGTFLLFMSLSTLVWIVYTIWVGVMKSDPGTNEYGAPPGVLTSQSGPPGGDVPPTQDGAPGGGAPPPAGS